MRRSVAGNLTTVAGIPTEVVGPERSLREGRTPALGLARPCDRVAAAPADQRHGEQARPDLDDRAEAIEAHDPPTFGARHLLERGVRVHGHRVADRPHHRQVGLRIRVRERLGQVDPLAGRDLADRLRLALAVCERAGGTAGVHAVAHLRAHPDPAVEHQHVGEHLGELLRGRGDDIGRAARVLVRVGLAQHVLVEQRQDPGEHVRSEPLEVDHALPRERVEDALAELVRALVGRAPDPELQVCPDIAHQLAPRQHPVLVGRAPEVERARSFDERPVQVEEGGPAPCLAGPLQVPFTSMITASPWPPPEQIAATPSPPPRRRSSFASVIRMRAPLAPIGWPSAIAPPFTFTFDSSTPSIRIELSATDANASLISNRSISSTERPALSSAAWVALAGVRARYGKSSATAAWATIVASGVRSLRFAHSSLESTTAPAPSFTPGALPAVCAPSLLNAPFSLESDSSDDSRRGASSTSTVVSPFRDDTVTGTISSGSRPSSVAWTASSCERRANLSMSARVISSSSPTSSASAPMCLPVKGLVRPSCTIASSAFASPKR